MRTFQVVKCLNHHCDVYPGLSTGEALKEFECESCPAFPSSGPPQQVTLEGGPDKAEHVVLEEKLTNVKNISGQVPKTEVQVQSDDTKY